MSDQDNIKKFDEFFKSNFGEFEPTLPENAWENIDKRLPSKPAGNYTGLWLLGLAGIFAAFIFIYNNKASSPAPAEVTFQSNDAVNAGGSPSTEASGKTASGTNSGAKGTTDGLIAPGQSGVMTAESNGITSSEPEKKIIAGTNTPQSSAASEPMNGKPKPADNNKKKQEQPGVPETNNGSAGSPDFIFPPATAQGNLAPVTGPVPPRAKPVAATRDAAFALIDSIVCTGEQVRCLNISNDRFSRFSWDFGDNSSSADKSPGHAYAVEGTYIIVLKAFAGEEVKKFSRKVYVQKVKAFFAADITAMPNVSFTNLSIGAQKYFWDFGDGHTNTTDKNANHTYNSMKSEHAVRLIAYNSSGCADTFSLHVVNNDLADKEKKPLMGNIFSPNADGINDRFEVIMEGEIYYHLVVVDRNGTKVFESFDKNNTWNGDRIGTGLPCPNGEYYYFFNYQVENKNPVKTKGSITLTR